MRIRVPIRVAAVALACALVAAGCERASQPQARAELVWAIGEIDAVPDGPAQVIARMWNDQNPSGPKVRVHGLPASADHQRQLMATELNAGLGGFDILTLDVVWTGEFAENGWLADLQDRAPRFRNVALAVPMQSAMWSGRLWAAPFISDAGILYYRTDLVTTVPTTWEEMVRVGLAVGAREGIAPFVGQGAQYEGMVVTYLELLWGAGGDLFDAGGTNVDFDDAPARKALDFMRDAYQRGFYAKGFETMREEEARIAFQNGGAVFMRNWPYAYPHLAGLENGSISNVVGRFGIAPLPAFHGKGTTSATGGHNLAVSRFSQSRRAAKDFVTFASTSPEVQRLLAEKYRRGPALTSAYDGLGADPVMAPLGRILRDAKPRPPTPEWSAISDEIQQNVFPAYTGPLPSAAAVREIRSFLELTAKP
ncbi:MAG: ABC transporter substrate-binding protein [Actinomycetota bacterium]|nr:ABC transporter substrate-binding protein [Actinomycetota bacterium]